MFHDITAYNILNTHKATGPDGIPTQALKELAHELTPVMSLFFQASVNKGSIPDEWKEANVVPIFKKDDKSKAVNYRPESPRIAWSCYFHHCQ
jgi:hypothetical protein